MSTPKFIAAIPLIAIVFCSYYSLGICEDNVEEHQTKYMVVIDNKGMDISEAEGAIINKIKYGDTKERIVVTDILINRPESYVLNKNYVDALIELFNNMPDTIPYKDSIENTTEYMDGELKANLFVLIATSGDPRAETIYENIMNGNDELFKNAARELKVFISKQKSQPKAHNTEDRAMSFMYSFEEEKELAMFLDYMLNSDNKEIVARTLENIKGNIKYLQLKDKNEERITVIKEIKKLYLRTKDDYLKPDLIHILGVLGSKKEVGEFIDGIRRQSKSNNKIKEAAENEIRYLNDK